MDKLLAPTRSLLPHHTVGDWDKPIAGWLLTLAIFVSPPSSLFCFATQDHAFLCRLGQSLCLPAGRIVSQIYPQFINDYWLTFRNQAPLGTEEVKDCYLISCSTSLRIDFGIRINNVYTKLDEWFVPWTLSTWQHLRVTWWNTYDEQNTLAIAVQLEVFEAGAWVDKGIRYDWNNRWAASTINRVGLAIHATGVAFDDTEIWVTSLGWVWYEPWGATLTENYPWVETGFLFGSHTSLADGKMTLVNDGQHSISVIYDPPTTTLPLIDNLGRHLTLHYSSPEASYHPTDGWMAYNFRTEKGADQFWTEPIVYRGTLWGPFGTYEAIEGNLFVKDIEPTSGILDLADFWIYGRNLAGFDPNPAGWHITRIWINNEQFATTIEQTHTNDYLGFTYE